MKATKFTLNKLFKQISLHTGIYLLAGMMLFPLSARAADIDIYSGLLGATGNPNILIVLDNAANFSSSAGGAGTCTLTNTDTGVTAVNSLAGTVGGIEQCAFYQVLSGLPPINAGDATRVNIGFMVYNASGITDYTGANCGGSTGGCLVYPLQPLTTATKQSMKNWITTWDTSAGGAGKFFIKASGEAVAATMQEAWAYYAGGTGLSGRSYAAIQPASGCQKNFVIFLGNSFSAAGTPGDGGSASPAAALTTAYGATPVPSLILGTKNTTCGTYTFPSAPATHEGGGYYADEWSRFMHNSADIFSASSGQQNIITYTVGVLGASCQAQYAALLDSMAGHGGGKYFATSDDNSVVQALLRILNEVQAVNSVFSSATLPVSVNTQGTYLNQIYMGMFRPDMSGNPRWIGNVKQYQFAFDANLNLYLSDATKLPAISSAGTGFITPNAASFWSCRSSANAALIPVLQPPYNTLPTCALDPDKGFWANSPDYVANTAGGAFDLQDGEVVEKGGAGQQLRIANLNNDYASSPAAPRKLFTDCPAGGCTLPYALSAHPFATGNSNITAAMFGTGLNLTVTSITRAGSVATATTSGSHSLVAGNTVTIVGATPSDYNGLVTITAIPASNKFSYFVQEFPPTTATTVTSGGIGGYVANQPGGTTTYPLASLSRVAAGTSATATVTAVTTAATPFVNGDSVTMGGITPSNYNLTQSISLVNATTFTFPIAVNPPPTAVGSYRVSLANASLLSVASFPSCSPSKVVTLQTTTSHGLKTGDQVTVSGDIQSPAAKQGNGTFAPITVLSTTSFSYSAASCPGVAAVNAVVQGGPVSPLSVTLKRNETAVGTATVTAIIGSSGQFANGDLVDITAAPSTTTPSNETGYLVSSKAISCATNPCDTVFSFTISTTPATQPGGSSMTAAGAAPSQPISSLTRVGATATATVAAGEPGFNNGVTVSIQTAPGTTLAAHEGDYTGSRPITCIGASPCTTFTYAPVTLTPAAQAAGSMSASNPSMTPDRTSLINWVRGEDNFGDESSLCPPGSTAGTAPCPSTRVTVRPSVHGDTLHSRPIALNYGSKGVVVYYGTNDGVYHAINGNQTSAIGSTPAGGELWGFVAKDFYGKFNRQRSNSPALQLPSTPEGILPTPQIKDYFIDGPTGVYQTIDGNGETTKAIIYIAARRGGRFIHAVDVLDPANPKYLWKISNASAGFEELGQTWSQPKVAMIRGYANPVLIFGAGYDDGAQDQEPPLSATDNGAGIDMGSDNIGRGIFIVDATTGLLVWQARHYSLSPYPWYWYRAWSKGALCTGTPPAAVVCDVPAMNYSIPADVTLMDKDNDGYIDRLYGVDTGGNVWRMDFEPTSGNTPDKWEITQLAALGCSWGPCDMQLLGYPTSANPATTQRKFFYPVEVIGGISTYNYDAIFVGSGDREHPLITNAAYNVTDRMYMIKDFYTGKTSTQFYPITENGTFGTSMRLADCTGTTTNPNTCTAASTGASSALPYDDALLTDAQRRSGYFFTLRKGEKVVNAPLTTAGYVYFGTNQPAIPDPLSCASNLGIARGYQLSPFGGQYASSIFDGGGLPPSPVSGIVDISNPDGTTTQAPFCVGCATPLSGAGNGSAGTGCEKSALEGCKPKIDVSNNRRRNYWYLNNK